MTKPSIIRLPHGLEAEDVTLAPADTRLSRAEETDDHDEGFTPTPTLGEAAWYGPLGAVVQAVEPHTEAHPAAILFSLIVMFGAAAGRLPAQILDGSRHGVNLFVLLVGPSSDGRKGTAVKRAMHIMAELVDDFLKTNVASGLTSGEGIIYRVRDAAPAADGKESGDLGVKDKRLLISEEEMGAAFRKAQGRENNLGHVLRKSWDGDSLKTLTRHNALTASDPHVALIGQITPEELRSVTTDVDFSGGTLNRFLFAWTERMRVLPNGGSPNPTTLGPVLAELRASLVLAQKVQQITSSSQADAWWAEHYLALSTVATGRLGQATKRGAPIVKRVAAIYALATQRDYLTPADLDAALAVWEYSVASAARVFGRTMLSKRAQRLWDAIADAGKTGCTRTALRAVLGNAVAAEDITRALGELRDAGLARVTLIATGKRMREVWHSTASLLGSLELGDNGVKGGYQPPDGTMTQLSPKSPLSPSSVERVEDMLEPAPTRVAHRNDDGRPFGCSTCSRRFYDDKSGDPCFFCRKAAEGKGEGGVSNAA